MSSRRYIEKYRRLRAPPTASDFLEYLESLNQKDWYDLIEDLLSSPSHLRIVFTPSPGEDVLPYLSTFLQDLSRPSRRIALQEMESALRRYLRSPPAHSVQVAIDSLLFLISPLSDEASAALLREIILNQRVSPDNRISAAAALAASSSIEHLSFWKAIDLAAEPFLSPIVFLALTEISPREAVSLLPKLTGTLPDELTYSIDVLLSQASRDDALQKDIARCFPDLPSDVQVLFRQSSLFDEGRYIPSPTPQLTGVPRLSKWSAFCKQAAESGRIDFAYSHSFEGKLFSSSQTIPDCLRRYLTEVREEIIQSLPDRDARPSLVLNQVPIGDLAQFLPSIWSGETILAEVAYATQARGKKIDLIRVGQIPVLTTVGHRDICKEIADILDLDLTPGSENRPKLSRVLDTCWNYNIKCIVQVGTDISELLEEYRAHQTRNVDTVIATAFLEKSQAIHIDDPEVIAKSLPAQRYLAFLDPIIGIDVKKNPNSDLAYFTVTHEDPLPVGFPVPGREKEFGTHLLRAVQKALFPDGSWDNEFTEMLLRAAIALDAGPSLVSLEQNQWAEVRAEVA